MSEFSLAVGRALRRARNARGLTLFDVRRVTEGMFKPSAIGAYERGERQITLDRFCRLSTVYGIPADRLLADAIRDPESEVPRAVVIHLDRLTPADETSSNPVAEFVEGIRASRGEGHASSIVLRAADLGELSLRYGRSPIELLNDLRDVIELS